jgi:hypothetical protein
METIIPVPAQSQEHCAACYSAVADTDVYCTNCGYPLKGSEKEQSDFILKKDIAGIDIASYNKRLKAAANSLYYLAGLFMVISIIVFFVRKDDPDVIGLVIPYLILAFIFLALGGYTHKKPLACIVSGLSLYVIEIVINAIDNPATIISGIILKIVIIGYLVRGIRSAIKIEKIKKENNIA